MIGATVFGAVLSWWERNPAGLASARRSETRHLLPWVGLRLLAALVAARGLITVLTWPSGRSLGALCVLFSLPYLFPWALARLSVARGWLGWAEGFGRLAAAHFRGSSHLSGLAARAWGAWTKDEPQALREATKSLEAHGYGPESILCRSALAQLDGYPETARTLLESLHDFGPDALCTPLRPWLYVLREGLPAETRARTMPAAGGFPAGLASALDDDEASISHWRDKWRDLRDAQGLLNELREQLARWINPPAPIHPPNQADWGGELEAFRARCQYAETLLIPLEWSTWCSLRARAESLDGPQGALRLRELWDPASQFAVRLWAEPGARPLAAAVLRWLEGRARELDDSSRYASASRQLLLAS